jgi:glutamate-1-semialdehyde 2,1-aminomutase
VLADRAGVLAEGLQGAFDDAGLIARTSSLAGLVGLHFGDHLPRDYADARTTDEAVYAAFFHALLARGVALAPGAYEVAFPGLAHDDVVLEAIVEAAGAAAADVVAAAAGVGTTAPG